MRRPPHARPPLCLLALFLPLPAARAGAQAGAPPSTASTAPPAPRASSNCRWSNDPHLVLPDTVAARAGPLRHKCPGDPAGSPALKGRSRDLPLEMAAAGGRAPDPRSGSGCVAARPHLE